MLLIHNLVTMIYYITSWKEEDDKFLPIYQSNDETDENLKDDEFKFIGELNSPEFEQHFNDNIVISSDSNFSKVN